MMEPLAVAVAVQSFHESDCLISRLRSKFYSQYSSDDILSQEHKVTVPCDMCKEFFKDTFYAMNKFPKKEPINFCRSYDN